MPARIRPPETDTGVDRKTKVTREFQVVLENASSPSTLGNLIARLADMNPCLEMRPPGEAESPEVDEEGVDEAEREAEQPDDADEAGDFPEADRDFGGAQAGPPVLDRLSPQEVAEALAEVEFTDEELPGVLEAISLYFAGEPIPPQGALKDRLEAFLEDVRKVAGGEEEGEGVEPFLRVGRSEEGVEVFAPPGWETLCITEVPGLRRAFPEEALEAHNLIAAIRAHQADLQTLAAYVVENQAAFFVARTLSEGLVALRPMAQKTLAPVLNCKESTVSRLIHGKYVETPFGVIPLRWFFQRPTRSKGNEDRTRLDLEQAVAQIIAQEDRQKPLSDEATSRKLSEAGFRGISRKNVSNILLKLGI